WFEGTHGRQRVGHGHIHGGQSPKPSTPAAPARLPERSGGGVATGACARTDVHGNCALRLGPWRNPHRRAREEARTAGLGIQSKMEIQRMSKKNVLLAVALSALVVAAPMSALVVAAPMSALAKKKQSGVGPGMNEAGEVVNSSEVEAGWGEEVVGINDYE